MNTTTRPAHDPTVFHLVGRTAPLKSVLQAAGALYCGDAWLVTAALADRYVGCDGLTVRPVENRVALALDKCYSNITGEPSVLTTDEAFVRCYTKLLPAHVAQALRGASKGLLAVITEQLTAVVAHARRLGLPTEHWTSLL